MDRGIYARAAPYWPRSIDAIPKTGQDQPRNQRDRHRRHRTDGQVRAGRCRWHLRSRSGRADRVVPRQSALRGRAGGIRPHHGAGRGAGRQLPRHRALVRAQRRDLRPLPEKPATTTKLDRLHQDRGLRQHGRRRGDGRDRDRRHGRGQPRTAADRRDRRAADPQRRSVRDGDTGARAHGRKRHGRGTRKTESSG